MIGSGSRNEPVLMASVYKLRLCIYLDLAFWYSNRVYIAADLTANYLTK